MTQDEFFGSERSLPPLPHGAEVALHPRAIPAPEAARLFVALRSEISWEQDRIRMFGKIIDLPRLTAWYGDPGRSYTYSGIAMEPRQWTDALREVKNLVEHLAETTFNSALANLYRHKGDKLAWHSDDEPELGPAPIIASVSLGATRRFFIRNKADHTDKAVIRLEHGDVLVMAGTTQQLCEHAIPGESHKVGERINLTFRRVEN